ncbi:MAG TPA: 1,4-alpha-glucan branching protein GlgB, partial [Clostridia bacterium]|nr:1,4-alpha-glucan branching protein GlgB [Clostridia bacterium]
DLYKYAIMTKKGELIYKADPYAFYSERRPETASIIWDPVPFKWTDEAHMQARRNPQTPPYEAPMSIYEVHLGSWREGRSYEQLAGELVDYVVDMGYTHVEFLPVCEYPLDDSWGYQVTGYYSITSRYGTPEQFKLLVNAFHRAGIGVLVDWVPAHFTRDAHGLRRFDGSALYEHPDPRRAEQPDWGTMLFNLEKSEVRSFLISNAVYLFREFHIDGLRVDAVSCMLYLDYGRRPGEWLPNEYGGHENLSAVEFFRALSRAVDRECPGSLLIAEESTAFPLVTAPPEDGGLGFHFKWNMGWMNDTLSYCKLDSYFRKFSHDKLTFSMCYAFSENYILPFSHDEVVHMKNSLIGRFPGTYDEMFAQLRLVYMYQYAHPGKKLLFMGGEFGQFTEWSFRRSLDWMLLDFPQHARLREFVKALNAFYKKEPALYERDDGWEGFEWRSVDDSAHSVLAFCRRDEKGNELLCIFNFTPVPHGAYPIRLPYRARLRRAMSSIEAPEKPVSVLEDAGGCTVRIPLEGYEGAWYKIEILS